MILKDDLVAVLFGFITKTFSEEAVFRSKNFHCSTLEVFENLNNLNQCSK
jgi:hypothetical protein